MKKLILAILIIVSTANVWAANLPQIATEQLVPGPWFSYVKSDSIKISEKDRIQNVKYSFNVKGPTDNDAIISCKIAFPKDIDVSFLSCSGVLRIGISKGKNILASTSYIKGGKNYFEFLILQKSNNKGFMELSLKIPYYYKNRKIPVAISYELMHKTQAIKDGISYKNSNNIYNTSAAVAGGSFVTGLIIAPVTTIFASVVIGAIAWPLIMVTDTLLASASDTSSPDARSTVQNLFNELKRNYNRLSLYSSTAHFTLHIE